MSVYVDANIILNVWRREIDTKTGKELWKGSGKLLERIELRECHGIIGITTVMEILHAVRVGAMKRELHGQEEVSKAIDKLRNYGLDFVIPTDVIMADSFSYFIDREIDPYDAVAISVAIHEGVDVFVSRDGKLRRKTLGLLSVKEPEELAASG